VLRFQKAEWEILPLKLSEKDAKTRVVGLSKLYRVTVDMRQHCTDGSFRLCRWRAHTEAWSEDSGSAALSTHSPYVALHVFYAIVQPIAGEVSANCCRTITMTRYSKYKFAYE
jgi:hypothetical protein